MTVLFNSYLLRAVEVIHANWSIRGYSNSAYTHDLALGSLGMKASDPPYTMCVAAQMEIIVTALNIYVQETGDKSCYSYLPANQWTSLSPGTFKDLVWVNSGSKGTADALEKFGMGEIVPFEQLTPGSFINLNRNNGSGHATLFLGFLDSAGNELPTYGKNAIGFKYYSSQGKKIGGGFDYRYAFFGDQCPILDASKKRDCGIIYSPDQKIMNTGVMWMPSHWKNHLLAQLRQIESSVEHGINPAYLEQNTTDD